MRPRNFILTVSIFAWFLLCLPRGNAQDTTNEKHIEVSLRMVGHQVLLSSEDSTSRVLPIIRENNQYRIQFESTFEFQPTELVSLIDRIVSQTGMASSYIVEVEHCETEEVFYSFKMDDLEPSIIIPCGNRMQPKACYSLLFTLLATAGKDTALLPIETVVNSENSDLLTYGIIAVPLLLAIGLFSYSWRRRKKPRNDPNLIPLGEYHFDKRKTELLINHEKIGLTGKEADLLLLLYKTVNTTVEREVILNKVWGDQGDYVGRTLDVFISKLRKKLEADSSVKIANIRGVGYKLVMDI